MIPVRSCVGCSARAPQATLVRFVAGSAGLVLDRGRRAGGRGAYLHPLEACWSAFGRRRGPVRSLRGNPTPSERAALAACLRAEQEGA